MRYGETPRRIVRGTVLIVCGVVATLAVLLLQRYGINRRLMQLAPSKFFDARFTWSQRPWKLKWAERWIGPDNLTALLCRSEELMVQGPQETVPDSRVLELLRASSGLREVAVQNRDLPDGCLEAIATRHLVNKLHIRFRKITADDAAWLSRLQGLRTLDLYLSGHEPRDNDWSWLSRLPSLTSLEVSMHGACDADVQALVKCPAVVDLSLTGQITDAHLAGLCDLPRLQRLYLCGDDARLHLPPGRKLPASLEFMGWGGDAVDDQSLTAMEGLPRLRSVHFTGGKISDEGLRLLARLPSLVQIHFDHAPNVTDAGLEALSTSASLRDINVRGCNTTPRGLMHLMQSPGWQEIRYEEIDFRRGKMDYSRLTLEYVEDSLKSRRRWQDYKRGQLESLSPTPPVVEGLPVLPGDQTED